MADASMNQASVFYFYNPTTVAFGKVEFKKTWGERSLGGNWRLSAGKTDLKENDTINGKTPTAENALAEEKIIEQNIQLIFI